MVTRAADWETGFKLERHEVATLMAILDDPPSGIDIDVVDRMRDRLLRIWDRKEGSQGG